MGIQGLLPALKSIMTPAHIRDFAGKRAAVDTYSWLHKAAFSCSKDICEGRPNDKYIDYCLHRVNLLRHYGVQPVLVFDGGVLPMKAEQELKRARSRKENLERALEHERLGNHSAAYECYQRALDITPAIAFRLIKVLRHENVEYVVAPYEADAQMAFLALNGHVDLIITEDSDLIPYGCPRVFFKMDKFGQGVDFQYSDLVRTKELDFNNFTKQMVLQMCIMSGCDYLPSLPGMGVKRAHGLIKRFKSYQKVIKHLKFSGVMIEQQYEDGFEKAILTFLHQRVYDPTQAEIVHLTEPPSELGTDMDFLGPHLPQTLATAIARGQVDPTTNKPFEDESCPGKTEPERPVKLKADPPNKQLNLLIQKNVLTNYFLAPSEAAKKQFRAPRSIPGVSSPTPFASQEDNASQATPSPESCSLFNKFSLTPIHSPLFGTPTLTPSFDDSPTEVGETRFKDFASNVHRPSRSANKISGVSYNDENLYPTVDQPVDTSRISSSKRKTFVSPLQRTVSFQEVTGLKVRKQVSTSGVPSKRSGYFSQPGPPQVDPISPDVMCSTQQPSDANGSEISPGKIFTQGSQVNESSGIADHNMENLADAAAQALDNGHVHRDSATRKAGRSIDAIAAGKRKHIPAFKSHLLGERATKGAIFSSVSHVGQYASLAQRSMDHFVSAIAPFRCSNSGSRASGLRAPTKSGQSASTSRTLGASKSESFGQFAHTSGSNSPRPAGPIAAGTVRWQTYNPAGSIL